MSGLSDDLRHASRMVRRHPGFSAIVIATTALGIGFNTAVFSLLDALLLRPPAVVAPERLAHVYSAVSGDFLSHTPLAFPDYEDLRDRARRFGELAAYAWFPLALERGESSELVMAEAVTSNYFAMLGVVPARGRAFSPFEDRPGSASPVAILSHDGWLRHFAGSPDVIGREVRLNGRVFTVTGVAPRGFRSLIPGFSPDLWLPIHAAVSLPTGVTISFGGVTPRLERTADRAQRWVWVTGRLRPDASVEQARGELAALALQLGHEYPASNARRAFTAVAANEVRLSPGIDRAVWAGSLLVMGVFGSGLLLASANVASLFLARALRRRHEIATRLAIGADRRRLVRQLLLEGLLLALAGGGLGLLLARTSNAVLGRVGLPLTAAVGWPLELVLAPSLDLRVLCFALAAAALSAVVFALLPAVEATRSDLSAMLRDLGAAAAARGSHGLRETLVAVQVAVSVALLAAAGVALRNLVDTTRVDAGFEPEGAAIVTLSPDLLGYRMDDAEALFDRVRQRVSRLPGVSSAALASHLPLTAAINLRNVRSEAGDPSARELPVDFASVGPGYFEAMRIPLVAGRSFGGGDRSAAPRVVVVNETLASRLWPGSHALGRHLSDGSEVIGVVRNGKYRTLGESPRPFLYTSLGQDRRGTRTLVARTEGDTGPLLPAIRQAIRELDPRVPVSNPRTLAGTVDDALFLPRATAGLLGIFGALGLLLAAVGILGVIAYLASARTREIGLRLALGASRGAILRWLLNRGLAPVAAGLAAGVAVAVSAAWASSGFFTGIWPIDLRALLVAVSLLALAAITAAIVPVWRAANLDPATALRHE
ncbi:MAG: ADOP family duplicated permease [Vicinamibacteria bacterium]